MQLASANGGITTNAANLTLTGTAAKILDGTSNALSTFNNNTGSFTLATAATFTTGGSFTNAGTVNVEKGTTLAVGGTTNSYGQSAGTTTVDGTLTDTATAGISITGGTIQGAGSIKANVSIGGSGTAPTINVGDSGKAGLLSITGSYTQLSSGAMNVSIGGTAVGTQYSQLKITGAASLGGTLSVGLINSFTPTVGQTFTVLTAKSLTGTFSNTTIAINSTEQFSISYTSTGVVLTVVSIPPSKSGDAAQPAAQVAMASVKPSTVATSHTILTNELRHAISTRGSARPIFVASLGTSGHSEAVRAVGSEVERIWQHTNTASSWDHVAPVGTVRVELNGKTRPVISTVDGGDHIFRTMGPQSRLAGSSAVQKVPVRIMTPSLPHLR